MAKVADVALDTPRTRSLLFRTKRHAVVNGLFALNLEPAAQPQMTQQPLTGIGKGRRRGAGAR